MEIELAIIPAAGLGTRMRPLSLAGPKELLPFGPRPAIDSVIGELRSAGVKDIIVILSDNKEQIRHYLDGRLEDRNDSNYRGLRIRYCYQKELRGNAHAVLCARELIEDRDFIVAYPDQIIRDVAGIERLDNAHAQTDASVVQIIELGASQSALFANTGIVGEERFRGYSKIHSISNKSEQRLIIREGVVRRIFGRMLLTGEFLSVAERVGRNSHEIDDIPILQLLARCGALYGVDINPPYYDVGDLTSYGAALRSADAWECRRFRE